MSQTNTHKTTQSDTRSSAYIVGMGKYLPERRLTNADLEKMVETTDEWIVSRTGISERRIAASDEFTSDMGAKAAQAALADANVSADAVDMILTATMSPDYPAPGTAHLIQRLLGAKNAAACDIQATCTGFLYALGTAKAYVEAGIYNNVLVVATEKMSAFMDYTDRTSCVIFGDGAGAVLVSNRPGKFKIHNVRLGSDGEQAELVSIKGGGSRHPASAQTLTDNMHFFSMSGREVYKQAVRKMASISEECLQSLNLTPDSLDWVVPHQANARILDSFANAFAIPLEKVYKTLHKYGNTSASTLPIALCELCEENALKNGASILLVAFGGGLTWGASVLTYDGN